VHLAVSVMVSGMRLDPGGASHLTYCTNIHPGESWEEVRENLGRYLPAVKARVAPDRPLGVGLRLSGRAADALAAPAALAELREFLAANDLYVFTINGFPYGVFHRARVKEDVYLPDWQDPERLRYTNRLADLLAGLLPAEPGLEGSVSTVPGAFRARAADAGAAERIAGALLDHAAHLVDLEARTGRVVCLALEPEPCCLLETVEETVAFFQTRLLSGTAVRRFARRTGLDAGAAELALRRHLGVCLDLCHAAVEFEDPDIALAALRAAGIRIAKVQVSAGLRVPELDADALAALRAFDDDVYLHQVVERGPGGLTRYVDLPDALAAARESSGAREWRVHFHVPVFREDLGAFATTQPFLRRVLARHRESPLAAHLEVETYTWDVLPARYRGEPATDAVVRELEWTRAALAGAPL